MPYTDRARQLAYQNDWIARRRAAWFAEQGPCVDCGSSERLEADHVNPSDKLTHRVWTWTRSRRLAELSKCVVRCKSCHAKKTAVDRFGAIQHGTVRGYRNRCRCADCCEAKRQSRHVEPVTPAV